MKFGRRAESPIDDQLAEADIQDRMALASALRQKSMQGGELDNVGGHLIGSPWARALTGVAQGIQGAGERKKAEGMATDLATSKRERLAQALGGAGQEPTPEARLKRGMELMGNPDPQAQAVGQYMAESAQKEIEQRQKDQQAKYGEVNKDLRNMKTLMGNQDLQKQKAADAQALAEYKFQHPTPTAGGVPGAGNLTAASDGFLRINPQTNKVEYVVVDDKRPMPGAYDPTNKLKTHEAAAIGDASGDVVAGGGQPIALPGGAPQNAEPSPAAAPGQDAPPSATAPPVAQPSAAPGMGYKGQQQALAAGAKEIEKNVAIARTSLAKFDQEMPRVTALIDRLLTHPGLSGATGAKNWSSGFGLVDKPIAGSAEADFTALLSTAEAKEFLQGFEVLKGGGSITEAEGTKATAAMENLSRAQSDDQMRTALKDLRDAFSSARAKLEAVSRLGAAAPGAAPPPPADDEDALIGKYLNGQP